MNARAVAAVVCLALIAGLVGGLLGAEMFADAPGSRGFSFAGNGGDAAERAAAPHPGERRRPPRPSAPNRPESPRLRTGSS